ncbi:MAG: TIGR03960 family B12-binding radical SAM protein [Actinomycetota bacterium]|nr:TIGR03960 family B12-binding radical SAM protein [Actinomycetota bacterium]MDP3630290.1 TIGR03960 family B12-binding radical SAM protein [Actinomycetota bacterium]
MTDLWKRIEPLLNVVERPARYVDHEWGASIRRDAAYRVALVYPDLYEIGMANQAIQILYGRLLTLPDVAAERVFLPWKDMIDALRGADVPLFTLETCTPVAECDLVGITLPYELTYTNILETLDLAGIPLRSSARSEKDPLVIGGGPCAFNPEPMASFFDAILIGDGEEAVLEIVAVHRAAKERGASREEVLAALAAIPGVYVPSLWAPEGARLRASAPAPAQVRKRILGDLGSYEAPTCPVVPFMDVVHDRVAIEVLRGCARGCRFCQAGMVYRPVRERTPDAIVRDASAALTCTGYEEVSLTSLSTADHSCLEEVLRRLTRRLEGTGIGVSLPSLRVDAFSVGIARLLGGGKKTGLTFAPEAGTQRLRDVINKNVTEDDLIGTVTKAFDAGWRRVKLYFMIGLPTETDEDIKGIGELVSRVWAAAREATPPAERGGLKVAVSVSTFVPKAHTPFQWEAQIALEEVRRRQGVLRDAMPRKGVDLSYHDPEVSFLEGVLARGGREVADVIEAAWRSGARFDAWTEEFDPRKWREAFTLTGIDGTTIANRERELDETLPWAHISAGVTTAYLRIERDRARAATPTPDCTFDGCTGCGVCGASGVANVLAGVRNG